jgi:hypothetical protein
MNLSRFKPSVFLHFVIACFLAAGCAPVEIATSEPGDDVSAVVPRSVRADIEKILGEPVREWSYSDDVCFVLYQYDGGYHGDLGSAAIFAIFDILTLGLFELFFLIDDIDWHEGSHEMLRMVVSYDKNNTVLGVFGEYAILPEDGRMASDR